MDGGSSSGWTGSFLLCNWGDFNPNGFITLDDKFKREDGVMKLFWDFLHDEWLYCDHGMGVLENTPSAKVFGGRFKCFGCSATYIVQWEDNNEEEYDFHDSDVLVLNNPSAHIPVESIPWHYLCPQFKWFVISAPMGVGKTERVAELI